MDSAIKFTRSGSITLTRGLLDQNLMVALKDAGKEIPEDEKNKIGDEYSRGENSGSCIHGWGVGLNIVKTFVGMLKGELSIDSQIGEGTTVSISIPVKIYSLITVLAAK